MSLWLQNLLVFAIVGICLVAVLRQLIRTLRRGKGKLGACCSKGCDAAHQTTPSAHRIVFLPADALYRRKR